MILPLLSGEQHSLGDFTSALKSAKRALQVRIKLFGEDHLQAQLIVTIHLR